VIWVFISEIFPDRHRAAGQTLGAATHWSCAAALTLVFPWLTATYRPASIFAGFCATTVLQLLWIWRLVPETKVSQRNRPTQLPKVCPAQLTTTPRSDRVWRWKAWRST
jgi:hypothetical protein